MSAPLRSIQCHAKNCRARVHITVAIYRGNQYWCSNKCAAGNNPPEHDKVVLKQLSRPQQAFNQGYWHLLQNKLPTIPQADPEVWA